MVKSTDSPKFVSGEYQESLTQGNLPGILVKLRFGELCDSKFSGLQTFDEIAIPLWRPLWEGARGKAKMRYYRTKWGGGLAIVLDV